MARPNYRQRERIRKRLKATATVCAICGKPFSDEEWWVDPRDGKRKRHPLSMEYDHIKPRAVCDAEGDTYGTWSWENAQAVHRVCNQRKGDGTRRQSRCEAFCGEGAPPTEQIPTSRAW